MNAILFKTDLPEQVSYWFLEVLPTQDSVTVNVYKCLELDWASEQQVSSTHQIIAWGEQLEHRIEHTMDTPLYFSVSVWEKYWFPKFPSDREDFTYQWYGLEEAEEMILLLRECVRLAAQHGIILGSR